MEPEVLLPGSRLVIKHPLQSQVETSRSMLELSVKTIQPKLNLDFDWATFLLLVLFFLTGNGFCIFPGADGKSGQPSWRKG